MPEAHDLVSALTYSGAVLVILLAIVRQAQQLKDRNLLLAAQAETLKTGELLQAIIERAPIRVFWKDRESRFLGCNSLFAQDAGYTQPAQLIGKSDFEMAWKDQAGLYRADDRKVMASGMAQLNYEEPQSSPDGRIHWLRTSKVPLSDPKSGEIIGVLGLYEDITERKRAEEELRIAATTFQTQEAILITNADAMILRVNQAFKEITGYSAEDVIGKNPTHSAIRPARCGFLPGHVVGTARHGQVVRRSMGQAQEWRDLPKIHHHYGGLR